MFTYYGHYMPGYCFPFLKIKYHCLIVVFMKIKLLYGQIQCTTFILKTLGFPSLTGYKSLPDYDVGSTPCHRCPYRVQEGSTWERGQTPADSYGQRRHDARGGGGLCAPRLEPTALQAPHSVSLWAGQVAAWQPCSPYGSPPGTASGLPVCTV